MSSAFFRRPGDDSSDSSSDDEDLNPDQHSRPSADSNPEAVIELASTESLSANTGPANHDQRDAGSVLNLEEHRNLMFASLLEDFYKTKAVELMNSNTRNGRYHRQSPEVQPLARQLYSEASQTLTANGFLPAAATSDTSTNARQQYLSALGNLSLRNVDMSGLPEQRRRSLEAEDALALVQTGRRGSDRVMGMMNQHLGGLISHSGRMSLSTPHSDMQLTLTSSRRSHYESSFQQVKLLGKGGFGRVYHAYNVFDRKEYAVKKIPLSPKLSQRYRQSGHQELESVLREVQALAQLEHTNVVRYHACWIEDPLTHHSPRPNMPNMLPSQRLLEFTPDQPKQEYLRPVSRSAQVKHSDGVTFGYSEASRHESVGLANARVHHAWSASEMHSVSQNSTSAHPSEIFTDGRSFHSQDPSRDDPSVYVLHVQMSLYPTTLSEYLAPIKTTASTARALSSPLRRHCFHLVPSLRILLGILCGLQYIHAKGLLHRDIKPGNIFLMTSDSISTWISSEGFYDVGSCNGCENTSPYHLNPRIGDFGLVTQLAMEAAERSSHSSPSNAKQVGTEYYRPPSDERQPDTDNRHMDEKVDVFALGVILVELLWCCNTASERMHVLKDLQKGRLPKGLAMKIDAEGHKTGTGLKVEECIKGMVGRDPRERWSCARVKEHVETILAGCKRAETGNVLGKVRSVGSAENNERMP